MQSATALGQAPESFVAFMDNLPAFAWIKDLQGRLVYLNKMMRTLREYKGEWFGKTDHAFWPAEIADQFRANDNEVVRTQKTVRTVEQYLANGETHYALVSKFPIFDQSGEVVRVGGASVDITDQKKMEEALAAQALRYKTLMETSTESIYVVDEKGDLQEANAAFLRRRGYSAAEVKGLNVADWDAQWTRKQLLERARKLIGSNAVFETRHRCKDGSVFDVEVGLTSVRIADKHLFFCVTRDITERKKAEQALRESEERFRQIAENINEVFWVWTANKQDARLVYVSPAYETIWGRTCESLYSSPRSWMKAIHPQDREWVLAEVTRLDLEEINDITYRIVRPDQSVRWIRDRIFPVRDTNRAVVRFAGIAEDVTKSKEAEDALHTANQQLRTLSHHRVQAQEDERKHLARELHDQIGQALTAAKISIQSAKRSKKRETMMHQLSDAMAILDRILLQVREITLHLRPSALDDLGLVPALRLVLDDYARRAGWDAQFFGDANLERPDAEVETACFRITLEALTNVLRHARARKVSVELHKDGNSLRLIVRDDGVGFDVAETQKRTPQDRLGLVGMSERVTAVGGNFECKSMPGRGTEVHASFPLSSGLTYPALHEQDTRSIGR